VTAPAIESAPQREAARAVETVGLTRRFGSIVAVDSLDLAIGDEIFGLLGPNGAGKTTTIKMLITLLPPTAGSARVAGLDVTAQAAMVRRRIGYVPQLVSADGALTGRENLELSAGLYHLAQPRRARIAEALRFMDLESAADRLVRTYSGGMIRRLELAQAMLHEPAVLFLDEPTVGLDPTGRDAVWDRVLSLRERQGTTILLTTHHLEEADALCDRVAIMHGGRIATMGQPAALKAAIGPTATLDDVFRLATGAAIDVGGAFRDVARTRRTANRLR
jgi:ABC-2 type transport system ATP-binding protein